MYIKCRNLFRKPFVLTCYVISHHNVLHYAALFFSLLSVSYPNNVLPSLARLTYERPALPRGGAWAGAARKVAAVGVVCAWVMSGSMEGVCLQLGRC